MVLQIETSSGWHDLIQYLSNDNIPGSWDDVLGANNDISIDGTPIVDIVNNKGVITLTTRYLANSVCNNLLDILKPKQSRLKTNYFGNESVYDAYRGNIQKVQITDDYAKLSLSFEMYGV